jgi:tetratricopeptide (TPR) repeat protein
MEDPTSATTVLASASARHRPQAFEPSQLVAGRFRVIRRIAEGGMGVVYEVFDERLRERRALKCAKPGYSAHLSPEAKNSLRVTHPNVCRVFEIHSAETSAGPVDFLTMEFIDGPTLAHAIRDRGRLSAAEGRDVALQVCAGLEAAHGQGLLHRDLKSNNVLLTRDSGGRTRAVVTDFGLAQEPSSPDGGLVAASDAGVPAGTPAYVAPERWRGGRASVASDIYSLGVLLHELIAGRLPVSETDGTKTLAPDLPRRWRRIITRCLDRNPARRYASATQVADAIVDRRAMARAAAWTAAALAAVGFLVWQVAFPETRAARLVIQPLVAAGDDPNISGLARTATSELSTRLAHLHPRPVQLIVIPVEEADGIAADDLAGAKDRFGASHVLQASVARRSDRLLVRASIIDTATSVTSRQWTQEYRGADSGAIAAGLAGFVSSTFRLPRQTAEERISAAAYAAYAEGSSALRRGASEYGAAIQAFDRAAAIDPTSVLPHSGLAEAYYYGWVNSGDKIWLSRARDALSRAQAINADALAVRLAAGRINLVPGGFDRAAEEYRRATELDPSSAEAWSGLARAYEGMQDRHADAAAAYAKAIEVQPGYYRPLLNFGAFYWDLGNYAEAEKQWLAAVRLAPESFSAHSNLGGLYIATGRFAEAERALVRALEVDPGARAPMSNLGVVYQYLGRDEDAVTRFEQARASGETYLLLLNLGDSYRRLGRTEEAMAVYRRGREVADGILLPNPLDAATRAVVAYFALRLGERATAERELAQALSLASQDGMVIRRAAHCFEVLGLRDRTLEVLEAAPVAVVHELSRHPDLTALNADPRFLAMLSGD